MKWKPIEKDEIFEKINNSWKRMSIQQRKLWRVIKCYPEKWKLNPWGKPGKGFWVVAIIDFTVVWYNDIEEGFNRSKFTKNGVIDEYWCNQDELEWVVQYILDEINEEHSSELKAGPPKPFPF
jgi:hypothetical protein